MAMPNVLDQVKDLLKKPKEKNIAVLVDGPNMIRKELGVDLDKVKKKLQKYGRVKVAKVFLDQFASDKLIEAVTNQGYEVVIIPSDVDVALAIEATEFMFSPHIDTIAIVSRDSDYKPVLTKAKEHGKDTIVVGTEPDFSSALKNTADLVIDLKAEGGLMDRREPRDDRGQRDDRRDYRGERQEGRDYRHEVRDNVPLAHKPPEQSAAVPEHHAHTEDKPKTEYQGHHKPADEKAKTGSTDGQSLEKSQ
ncbi:MAG TPA: TIGR00288 family NYN domain-containing protein [Candidatus Norongarragalinales archaeon]|nr:TIGR00288 family NYN domain-containing protein [Candidatus Norongarragalinales archaeon]